MCNSIYISDHPGGQKKGRYITKRDFFCMRSGILTIFNIIITAKKYYCCFSLISGNFHGTVVIFYFRYFIYFIFFAPYKNLIIKFRILQYRYMKCTPVKFGTTGILLLSKAISFLESRQNTAAQIVFKIIYIHIHITKEHYYHLTDFCTSRFYRTITRKCQLHTNMISASIAISQIISKKSNLLTYLFL